jgi:hypothetical protein
MTEVIHRPIGGPIEGAPVAGAPMPKPDVPVTTTDLKEAQASRSERRRRRVEEVTISAKDAPAIDLGDKPAKPIVRDLSKYANDDGSMSLQTAQRARAKEVNISYGHGLNDAHLGHRDPSHDAAEGYAQYVSERGRKASEPPKTNVGLVKDDGTPLRSLADGSSVNDVLRQDGERAFGIGEADQRDLTRYMANARQVDALAREQFQAEVKQGIAASEAQQMELEAKAAEPPPKPAPQPNAAEQARQAQARQAQARQQSDWQRLQDFLARASVEEMRNNRDWEVYRQQLAQVPEFRDQRLMAETFTKNPQRYQQLVQAAQADQQYAARAAELRNQRQAREVQANQVRAQYHRQQVAAYAEREDAKFSDWVAAEVPEFSTAEGKRRLSAAAREVLKSTGLSDAEITQQWQSGHLRPFGFQKVIAEAARWKMARESMRNVQRQQLPPVQKPGTLAGRARDGGAAEEVQRLERDLRNATSTRQQLLIAGKLQRAKREAR